MIKKLDAPPNVDFLFILSDSIDHPIYHIVLFQHWEEPVAFSSIEHAGVYEEGTNCCAYDVFLVAF